MNQSKVIKRYPNRKLYDTETGNYLTLGKMANLIRQGERIVVIDSSSGQDVTYNTKMQLLFERERHFGKGDTELLRRIICSGDGTFTGHIKNLEEEDYNSFTGTYDGMIN